MTNTMGLSDDAIIQPIWVTQFLLDEFMDLYKWGSLYADAGQAITFDHYDYEDYFYESEVAMFMFYGDHTIFTRIVQYFQAVDHIQKSEIPAEGLLHVSSLVSRFFYFSYLFILLSDRDF